MGALNIKNPEARALAQRLATLTGQSMTVAVLEALKEQVAKKEHAAAAQERYRRLMEIIEEVKKMPKDMSRTEDEILGYNESGGFD